MIGTYAIPEKNIMDRHALPPKSTDETNPTPIYPGEDPFPPNVIPSVNSVEHSIERSLSRVTPELEKQVDIQMGLVETWAAFKVRPHLVAQIYKGESLDVNLAEIRDTVIIPAYREQQLTYLGEQAAIIGTTIPERLTRLEEVREDLAWREESINAAEQKQQAAPYPNPRLDLDIISWQSQARERRTDIKNIEDHVSKLKFSAQIKQATFAHIEHFMTTATPEELDVKAEAITRVAKKDALFEVIQLLKREQLEIDAQSEEEGVSLAGNHEKIALLQAELDALVNVELYNQVEIEAKKIDTTSTATRNHETIAQVRSRIKIVPTIAYRAIGAAFAR